jgi:type II secretory pathway pseudopilin PulG
MYAQTQRQCGISLLEVLAAIFVVSIGLLGVLAVIPFGAFQVSKAQHAEYASNMLANAAEEIYIRDLLDWGFNTPSGPRQAIPSPQTRTVPSTPKPFPSETITTSLGKPAQRTITERHTTRATATPYKEAFIESFGEMVLVRIVIVVTGECIIETTTEIVPDDPNDPRIPPQTSTEHFPFRNEYSTRLYAFNCTRFLWFEPRGSDAFPPNLVHIFPLSSFQPVQARQELIKKWEEPMRGHDDLVYSTYDHKRPDFAGQNDKVQSSGKYNWFFTLMPSPADDWHRSTNVRIHSTCGCRYKESIEFSLSIPLGRDMVLVSDVNGIVTPVDILACYNRVPDYDRQVSIPSGNFTPSSRGGTITFSNVGADIVDRLTQTKYVFVSWKESSKTRGAWCKIVFLDKDVLSNRNPQIVVTGNLQNVGENIRVYIPNGVLYHKRLRSVQFK